MGCLGYDNLYNSLQYVLMRWDVYTIIMNRQFVILLPPFFFMHLHLISMKAEYIKIVYLLVVSDLMVTSSSIQIYTKFRDSRNVRGFNHKEVCI